MSNSQQSKLYQPTSGLEPFYFPASCRVSRVLETLILFQGLQWETIPRRYLNLIDETDSSYFWNQLFICRKFIPKIHRRKEGRRSVVDRKRTKHFILFPRFLAKSRNYRGPISRRYPIYRKTSLTYLPLCSPEIRTGEATHAWNTELKSRDNYHGKKKERCP